MFSWYKYLIVNLVFSHLGFWSGNLFLIAPFPFLIIAYLYFFKDLKTFEALDKNQKLDSFKTNENINMKQCLENKTKLVSLNIPADLKVPK